MGQRKEEWPNADPLTLANQRGIGDAATADKDAVDAAEVAQQRPFADRSRSAW